MVAPIESSTSSPEGAAIQASVPPAPRRRPITADEYHRMADAGILGPEERVELLDGVIVQMSPINAPHNATVWRLIDVFAPRLHGRAVVSAQGSFRLSQFSEPEPDIAIFRYRDDFYRGAHPRPEDVLLIIEVSDTSLRYDRDDKLPRYAAAGIPEAWIADVQRNRLTVHRDPTPDGYRQVVTLTRRATISPLAFPDLVLCWEDIFGKP
jgi:Uma2 family endonuclease